MNTRSEMSRQTDGYVQDIELQLINLDAKFQCEKRRWRVQTGIATFFTVSSVLLSPATRDAFAQVGASLEQRVAALEAAMAAEETSRKAADTALASRTSALESKTRFMSVSGTTTRFLNTNVQIASGSGRTDGVVNGRGNLIIGYNENANGYNRAGSHNLVLGFGNGYSSFGGLVVGQYNQSTGPCASVSGGYGNIANGFCSSVSGGGGNVAGGDISSVSGGQENTATKGWSSVSGGFGNVASGKWSSASGGWLNAAKGDYSSVSGGESNISFGLISTVSGGYGNVTPGQWGSVSGGWGNTASGEFSSVSGGNAVTISSYRGWGAASLHSP